VKICQPKLDIKHFQFIYVCVGIIWATSKLWSCLFSFITSFVGKLDSPLLSSRQRTRSFTIRMKAKWLIQVVAGTLFY
jgi:hypothetical protein